MSKRSNSIANKVYKYVHNQDVWIQTNILGRQLENDWLRITEDGKMTLKGSTASGYAWDGCSPKWHFIHLLWGTPDGKLDYRTEKPLTFYASMMHDVMYQFKAEAPVSRKEADIIFKLILKEAGFMWWWLYGFGVRFGGGLYGKWKTKSSQKNISVTEVSWL